MCWSDGHVAGAAHSLSERHASPTAFGAEHVPLSHAPSRQERPSPHASPIPTSTGQVASSDDERAVHTPSRHEGEKELASLHVSPGSSNAVHFGDEPLLVHWQRTTLPEGWAHSPSCWQLAPSARVPTLSSVEEDEQAPTTREVANRKSEGSNLISTPTRWGKGLFPAGLPRVVPWCCMRRASRVSARVLGRKPARR